MTNDITGIIKNITENLKLIDQKGFNRGYEAGYKEGIKRGKEDGWKMMQDMLKDNPDLVGLCTEEKYSWEKVEKLYNEYLETIRKDNLTIGALVYNPLQAVKAIVTHLNSSDDIFTVLTEKGDIRQMHGDEINLIEGRTAFDLFTEEEKSYV